MKPMIPAVDPPHVEENALVAKLLPEESREMLRVSQILPTAVVDEYRSRQG
jgi:hypothetical protein